MSPDPHAAATAHPVAFATTLDARVLRHDPQWGLSTLYFGDGELRVPMVAAPVDSGVRVTIDARDVAVALTRPMDVSITNRLPGTIVEVERLAAPYARVRFDLGATRLDALVTWESVERLALEPGLKAWAMIKSVAIGNEAVRPSDLPSPRRWPVVRSPDRAPP
ncbi:TOBE domain-containing protein [Rhodoplanes roseus]|uniref:Molybdenum ABC transporter ATP-binding protein n=1 Tax=Rhodoplanes roseus TaxID=29409 RepID=A0A327L679_9BRAD|nr:TOBE domain-containing protein [Rhodoplanes roseus]RAI46051.1 molybdenum ABC transporter ATP-binding protein [Rhodoplanes roseus]